MGKKVKKIVSMGIMALVTVSALNSVISQFFSLNEAKKQVDLLQDKNSQLVSENENLKQKLEYATSSAYIEQTMRDKFGLGTSNDYWIKGIELK